MTIADYLQNRIKTINRVKWAGTGGAAAAALACAYLGVPRMVTYLAIAAPMVPAVVAMGVLGKRLKCPRCSADLRRQLYAPGAEAPGFCPKCGCSFSEPMAEAPYNPIS
jgi:hypothetical protein